MTQPIAAEWQTAGDLLEEAFARYQSELLGTLYYVLGNREDARDALQETFLKCWRHRTSAEGVDNLKAWIFRVALNTGRDLRATAWRRRRKGLDGNATDVPSSHAGPEADCERREQLELLRQAIAALRPEEQEIFLLRQNGDLTYEEIAATLDLPVGTVKTRMRLALQRLREAMPQDESD